MTRLNMGWFLGILALPTLVLFALPTAAGAHGLVGRQDLPIPEVVFAYAAAAVLVVSFAALGSLWNEPRLKETGWRPLPAPVSRVLTSRVVDIAGGLVGVILLAVVLTTGFAGADTSPAANLAPNFVYVVFWLGLVAASVLLGDVFRWLNPWRAIGRFFGWLLSLYELPKPLTYPTWLAMWPAALGLIGFVWLELVLADGDQPDTVAMAALVYTAITLVGMALFGVDEWIKRGEAFSVYFRLYSHIAPFERRDDEIGVRPPLSGLSRLEPEPGLVLIVAVMIGTVSFDGFSAGKTWQDIAREIQTVTTDFASSPQQALEMSYTIGLVSVVAITYGFFRLGIALSSWFGGGASGRRLAAEFSPSMVPIAFAYCAAHYVSLLLIQGQAIGFLISDPVGDGRSDYFGTVDWTVDYGWISAEMYWYFQVGFVIAGHVSALVLMHDRALELAGDARTAMRSQLPMLLVMVGYTSLALWLLSEASKG